MDDKRVYRNDISYEIWICDKYLHFSIFLTRANLYLRLS